MNFYVVSNGKYEYYNEVLLMHEVKFTKQEFDGMCKKAESLLDGHFKEDLVGVIIYEFGFKEVREVARYHSEEWW